MSLGLNTSCSSGTPSTPTPYKSSSQQNDDVQQSDDKDDQDDQDDQQTTIPLPSNTGTDTTANPTPVKPASVSVSLSPTTLSTTGEGFYVRGLRLANGSMLVAYCQNIDNQYTVKTEVSSDEGKTWRALGQIVSVPFRTDGAEVAFEPTMVALPSGALLAVYLNFLADGTRRLQAAKSVDNGKTWTFQGDAEVTTDGSRILHPNLFVNSKGQVQAYYSKPRASDGFEEIVMRTTSDEGRTWSGMTIVASRSNGGSAFSGATRLKDGSLLVVFDTARGDGVNNQIIRSVQSNNEGLTWTSPKDVYIPPNGEKRALSPQVTMLDDGRPVVMFMSDEEQALLGIKLMIPQGVPTFSKLEWLPQAVPVISDGFQPGAIPSNDGSFILGFERSRKILMHRVSIKGGL